MDHKTSKHEVAEQAAPPERTFIKFPEDQFQGEGFTQLDPKTGWLWIGINLQKFTFRDAWAFIRGQEYMVSSYMTGLEQQAMVRARIASAAPKERGGIAALANKLGIKV